MRQSEIETVGGPYYPPGHKVGDVVWCERFGETIVGGFVDTPVGFWPRAKARGIRRLILCGDLVTAVKTESNLAVQKLWGVSESVVTKWRQSLAVEPYETEGSHRLRVKNVANIGEEGQRKGAEAQRRPEVRRKHEKRAMGNSKFGTGFRWTKTKDRVALENPVAIAAEKLGLSEDAVKSRRHRLRGGKRRFKIAADLKSLRESAGLTKQQTADALGMARQWWGDVESGRAGVIESRLHEIAKVLGVPVVSLVNVSQYPRFRGDYGDAAPVCPACNGTLYKSRSTVTCTLCARQWGSANVPNAHLIPTPETGGVNVEAKQEASRGKKRQRTGWHGHHKGTGYKRID